MNLRECFDSNGCDKGQRHGYERVYEPAFESIRDEPLRILEVGILAGASLAAWVDYFPNAAIVGMDLFGRVRPKDIPILNHPRIDWYHHDSTTPIDIGEFDIVIDDGSHTHISQRKTFECLGPCAARYFIEDVWAFDHMTPKQKQHKWLARGGYSEQEYRELLNALQPYTAEFHDLRAGYQPDSFIISVT